MQYKKFYGQFIAIRLVSERNISYTTINDVRRFTARHKIRRFLA